MMLARVADSLYWIGRYLERAEHLSRLSDVMLNATLDHSDAAAQASYIALSAVGDRELARGGTPYDAALALVLERGDPNSVVMSLARARENARQVRDQITTETWERINLVYLKVTGEDAAERFAAGSSAFLQDLIADLHLFRGAADATMSHGEGWRFLMLGAYLERAQLIARLLEVCFGDGENDGRPTDHIALMSLLRMACALEPYLRVYTAEMEPRFILEFLMFNQDFPRSIRFCTARIEEHLAGVHRQIDSGAVPPERLAGRLKARLEYADPAEVAQAGAGALLERVIDETADIHQALYETYVAYPLEMRLPA